MTLVVTARPLPPVPASVTPLQARRALRAAGLIAAVESWVDADATGQRREDWDYAVLIPRDDPLIDAAREALQLSVEQIDDLFRAAAAI